VSIAAKALPVLTMSTQPLDVGGRLKVALAVPLPPVREEPQVMILESDVRPAKAPVVVMPAKKSLLTIRVKTAVASGVVPMLLALPHATTVPLLRCAVKPPPLA